jgi:hypothetical protein
MPLSVGDKLGPYEIVAPLGAGGMGEVYRARDTKLKRDVAVKVLPEAFARDPDRMRRFQREAEVLASLNHPNIAHIYGVEERALVMELVEGESPKGPLPFDDAWKIAVQIAGALEYAHEKGVIHRDLKPANVKVTPDGVVKLLDFGLAKVFSETPDTGSADPENSPTITLGATVAGTVLGTAAYMSPEQAKGKKVDKRADIWSWGVVLYELLTGERLFEGDEAADTLAQVLTKEPNLDRVPPQAHRVLRRCLQKDPRRRLRDIGDVSILLEAAPGRPEEIGAKVTAQSASVLPRAVVALFAVAAVLGLVAYFRPTSANPQALKVSVTLPEKAEFGDSPPAVSADGHRIVFVAHSDGKDFLWVRDLDILSPRLLAGTEGADHPFWSPDSRFVGFFAGGKLKKIAADGGPAVTLCDVANGARGGSWSKRDIILFTPSPNSGVFWVPAAGGSPTLVKKPGRFPWFLPDGRHFLYSAALQGSPELYFADLDSKAEQPILAADTNAVYAPPGYLLFMREGSLLAQPFDSGSGKIAGEAVPVAEQVGSIISNGQGQFSASQNPAQSGVLVYTDRNPFESQLTWDDRSGNALGVAGKPASGPRASISRDGSMVAIDRADPRTGVIDVWLLNVANGTETRLTFHEPRNRFPLWSPDGSHLAFNSGRNLVQRVLTGPGQNSGSARICWILPVAVRPKSFP